MKPRNRIPPNTAIANTAPELIPPDWGLEFSDPFCSGGGGGDNWMIEEGVGGDSLGVEFDGGGGCVIGLAGGGVDDVGGGDSNDDGGGDGNDDGGCTGGAGDGLGGGGCCNDGGGDGSDDGGCGLGGGVWDEFLGGGGGERLGGVTVGGGGGLSGGGEVLDGTGDCGGGVRVGATGGGDGVEARGAGEVGVGDSTAGGGAEGGGDVAGGGAADCCCGGGAVAEEGGWVVLEDAGDGDAADIFIFLSLKLAFLSCANLLSQTKSLDLFEIENKKHVNKNECLCHQPNKYVSYFMHQSVNYLDHHHSAPLRGSPQPKLVFFE